MVGPLILKVLELLSVLNCHKYTVPASYKLTEFSLYSKIHPSRFCNKIYISICRALFHFCWNMKTRNRACSNPQYNALPGSNRQSPYSHKNLFKQTQTFLYNSCSQHSADQGPHSPFLTDLAGRKFIYEDDLLELYAKFLKCHEIRQQARFTYRSIISPPKNSVISVMSDTVFVSEIFQCQVQFALLLFARIAPHIHQQDASYTLFLV